MIYVRRDISIIPSKVLAVAEREQLKLEDMSDPEKRRLHIKKKSHIWRSFGKYLAKMSYGKCWYSESPDPQSFFDVDHFRPKAEAKRTDNETDKPGYDWLTFSWENFRYAANCSNRTSTNHDTGVVVGKGSWFPVMEGSVKANWNNRCENEESPVLIDPCNEGDVDLIEVCDDGRLVPSRYAIGSNKVRAERSVELYGLNLPRIKSARAKVMRDLTIQVDTLEQSINAGVHPDCPTVIADLQPIRNLMNAIKETTLPQSPYSLAARAMLRKLGRADLCASPEQCGGEH